MGGNIYVELTRAFNSGGVCALLSSGQAVVMHRLAIMSKDGDWILREDEGALDHVLGVLAERGARYRFGAPLDVRWMAGGWSAHFEFRAEALRVRTDFVTRPPRVSREAMRALWVEASGRGDPVPFVDAGTLAELKKTNREKDYAVIGELARLIEDPLRQMVLSRSARDLLELARAYPEAWERALEERPLLRDVAEGREALEAALDAERRALMHANERRLQAYREAARAWAEVWPGLAAAIADLPLREAHRRMVTEAEGLLPASVAEVGL
jgi:hypothetical protein